MSSSRPSSMLIPNDVLSLGSSDSGLGCMGTPVVAAASMTSLYDNYSSYQAGHKTYGQLLNSQQQGLLPVFLYIRNYNEYRRFRPNEARLAKARKERMEAREMRLRELEKQIKEMNDSSDRHYDIVSSGAASADFSALHRGSANYPLKPALSKETRASSYTSSRRSSQDSLDTFGTNPDTVREMRHQIHDLEDRFRKTMITNSQMDNEKQKFVYQIDLYKDEMDVLEESNIRITRDFKDKTRSYDQIKRDYEKLSLDFAQHKAALYERDRLLTEAGLVLIRNDQKQLELVSQKVYEKMCAKEDRAEMAASRKRWTNGTAMVNGNGDVDGEEEEIQDDDDQEEDELVSLELSNSLSLISPQANELLKEVEGQTLEAKLRKLLQDKQELGNIAREIEEELEEERRRHNSLHNSITNNSLHLNGEVQAEIQREVNKLTIDYRYKLKKAETEITTLSGNVSRLESQLARYKTAAEESERLEDELKADKRKAQRELREAQTRIEELESANAHLQKRIDKLKSNKVAAIGAELASSEVSS